MDVAPDGAKNQTHPRCYKHVAPPGLTQYPQPQNPLAPVFLKDHISVPAAAWARESRLSDQLAQHVRQDAAVLVVIDLDRRVDAQLHRNLFTCAVRAVNYQRDVLLWLDPVAQAHDVESF